MKKFPEKSVDLVLTDPPYNIADKSKLTKVGGKIKTNEEAWGEKFKDKWTSIDEYFNWIILVMKSIKRILKKEGSLVSFFDRKYTGYIIYLLEKIRLKFKNKIYFEKSNPLPHIRKNNYRSCIEEAIWFTISDKGNYYLNFISQERMKQIFRNNIGQKETSHPTEKYAWMIDPIIIRHSKKNDIVLDSMCGSGTTCKIAEKLGRQWIGIEISKKYCEIAKRRIKSEADQKKLF